MLDIPNRDHMRAVGDKVYKAGVADFLSRAAKSRLVLAAEMPDRRDQHHKVATHASRAP